MKGYKGFDKDLKCQGFQYEIGKDAEHDGKVELCLSGLHYCENPLDVLRYYQPATSRYAEVEADGVSEQKSEDSKRVAKKLKIIAEVRLKSIIDLGVKFLLSKSEKPVSGDSSPAATSGDYSPAATSGDYSPAATSGDSSPAATSGYYSPAATSGDSSPAATSGDSSPASTSGEESIAAAIGQEAKAKAAKGNWIVLAEYAPDSRKVRTVKTVKVDGKKIKADTFYKLKNGKFVVVNG